MNVRSSLYLDAHEKPTLYGYSVGAGWSYDFFEVDASFLGFVNQKDRKGSASLSEFEPSQLTNLDLNQYTQNRFVLSARAMFGRVAESVVQILGVGDSQVCISLQC